MKKITLLLLSFVVFTLSAQETLLDANFANFTNGALVGQNSWVQYNTASTEPLTVNAGVVTIAGARVADNQDVMYPFTTAIPQPATGTTTINVDAVLAVTSAGVSGPSYFLALNGLNTTTTTNNFQNARLAAIQNGDGFVLGTRVNGQAGYVYKYGTTKLTFGTYYAVRLTIKLVAGNQNDIIELYVGSDFTNLALQSTSTYSTGTVADPTFGAVLLSQYGSATVIESGVNFKSIKVVNIGTTSGFNSIAADKLQVSLVGNKLTVGNASTNVVEIFNTVGAKVQTLELINGATELNLQKGLYVVRAGKASAKIIL